MLWRLPTILLVTPSRVTFFFFPNFPPLSFFAPTGTHDCRKKRVPQKFLPCQEGSTARAKSLSLSLSLPLALSPSRSLPFHFVRFPSFRISKPSLFPPPIAVDVVLQQIRVPGHQVIRSTSAAAITGRGPSDAMTAANGGDGELDTGEGERRQLQPNRRRQKRRGGFIRNHSAEIKGREEEGRGRGEKKSLVDVLFLFPTHVRHMPWHIRRSR